ncbi:hypothetical protein DFH28DRAFT_1159998, partial [Melampsora americana]
QLATGEWLLRRLKHTKSTILESQKQLDESCSKPNPYQEGSNYSLDFFCEQWNSERKINLELSKDIKTRQRLELGRLLCLEDLQYKTWGEDAFDRDDGFDRLHRFEDIAREISAQRQKIGISDTLTTLSKQGEDLLLKVWFSKTEVRTRFLALRAEQRPLDPENKAGGGSTLGTHEKERILQAIQRRTRTMKRTLINYNRLAQEFQDMYPDQPTSPPLEYGDLITMEADNPFWNNAMRWATHEHDRLWNILLALKQAGGNPTVLVETFLDNPITNNPIDLIENFITNPVLESISMASKVGLVEGLLHTAFVKITGLELRWDNKVMQVLRRTSAQQGDYELEVMWKTQLLRVNQLRSQGFGSTKAGDFNHLFAAVNEGNNVINFDNINNNVDMVNHADDADNMSDLAEDEWEQRMNEGLMRNMMLAIGEEE